MPDVIPKRSIRRIPLPGGRVTDQGGKKRGERGRQTPPSSDRSNKHSRLLIWFLAVFSVVILLWIFSYVFSGATVLVFPKIDSSEVSLPLRASPQSATGLRYETVTLEKTLSETLPATGEERVERKASGEIIIYNNSATSQRLIKNTRFETSEGLVYRINASVVVPPRVISKSNRDSVPGSIVAVVFADVVGEKYNIDLADFTVPGFRGTPRYREIYARSKTSITGGFSGIVKKVSPELLSSAQGRLQQKLREELHAELSRQAAEKAIFYEGGSEINYTSIPPKVASVEAAEVVEQATLRAVVFDRDNLSAEIISSILRQSDRKLPFSVEGLQGLSFSIPNRPSGKITFGQPIEFSLTGGLKLIGTFDIVMLRRSLAEKDSSAETIKKIITEEFPGIQRVEVVVRPFWKKTFPRSIERIKVTVAESS